MGVQRSISIKAVAVSSLNSILRRSKMKRTIEIRAAEGGEDSKLFVTDLANAYQKLATKFG